MSQECGKTVGWLMHYVEKNFGSDPRRNCGIAGRLIKLFGLEEAESMIRGAKALGMDSLIPLNSKSGEARRWARAKFWYEINRRKANGGPMSLGQILRRAMRDAGNL